MSNSSTGQPLVFCARNVLAAIVFTMCTVAFSICAAQTQTAPALSQYKIDVWQTEQGLPHNTVQTTYQSRAGHLWIGTGAGLARFDGVRFTTFENAGVPLLATRPVFGFMEDADGNLWIGHGRGAALYRDGRFEAAIPDASFEGRRVWAFAEARDGVIWIASENGLIAWQKGKGVIKHYKDADGLPTKRLRALAFDNDGTLWIATTGGGLVSFADGKFSTLNPTNGFPHLEVRHVIADPAGGVWAATAGAGLVRVTRAAGANPVIKTYAVADGLPTDQLTYLARDKSGALWIGTWGAGLTRMMDGRFDSISSSAGAGGLAGDQLWSVHVDREGSIWAGTWNGGMNRLGTRAFGVFGKPEGLSGDNVRAVLHERGDATTANNATWVSIAGGGVNRIAGNQVTTYLKKDGLPADEASSLMQDRDGAIWVGTYTDGIARIANGKIEKFGTKEGLPNNDIRALVQDRNGTIWAGTQVGLARFDAGARRFVHVRDEGAPAEGITGIHEDKRGAIWIGTAGKGLVRHDNGAFKTYTRKDGLASNWIMALHEDASGTLWIGTNGEGLSRHKDGRISAIRTEDGLWDGLVQVIVEDKAGNLWMTCNRGFFRVPRAELDAFADGKINKVTSTSFGPGDALRSTSFAGGLQNAGAMRADGQLWLPSLKGLVIFDPQRLPGMDAPPRGFVEDVAVNGTSRAGIASVDLPAGSLPLAIRYTAGTLRNADRVRFRYQLEGATKDWIDAGTRREATFAQLPYGTFRFRVAASLDGVRWGEASEATTITVAPYFYQTVWFWVLSALALIGTTVAVFRLRTLRLRQNQAEMERIIATKTEELRLANEHLSALSFTDTLTGLANRRRLDEMLDLEWRRALRTKTPLAILMIDIDAFKSYNDTLGHPEGDKCLTIIAEVIRQIASRASDIAARYGGEEFVILVPGFDHAAALEYAERLRSACETRAITHPASPASAVVTISIGVAARVPGEGETHAALLAEADAALYQAKKDGRNCVR